MPHPTRPFLGPLLGPFLGPLLGAALLAALTAPAAASTPTALPALDLGAPSVQSQRGQRLKLVVPFGSTPGEPVSVTRFEVVSVQAPAGFQAPDPAGFTISKPASRNLVFLQSRESIEAPELTLTVRVADQPEGMQTWTVGVPPAQASMPMARADAAPRASGTERPARRGSARQASAAR
jgi:hypothetical protein